MSCQGYLSLEGILRASHANALEILPKRSIKALRASGVSLTDVLTDLVGCFDLGRATITP